MARIIISLCPEDIGNLLLGGEVTITPSVSKMDNLQEIVLRFDKYAMLDSFAKEEYDDLEIIDWSDTSQNRHASL